MPLRLRELLQQITQLIAKRRRSYGTRQEAQAGTLIPQMSRTQLINLHQKIAPTPHPPLADQHLRTIWIIEIQHGSLHEDVSASEAPGMVIIAFHLCRPPHEAPYQNALRNPLPWHGAGIEERFSGNELLRCVHVGTIFSTGIFVQAVSPARAAEAPISFSASRRFIPLRDFSTPYGNSWFRNLRYSSVSATSSRLRQNRLPVSASSLLRMETRSRRPFPLSLLLMNSPLPRSNNLPVTGVAVCDDSRRLNVILLHQLPPQGILVRRGFVSDAENILFGSDVAPGMLVAVNAPAHVKRVRSIGDRHIADRPMARGATNSFCNMNAVVEIDEIGEFVHPNPGDGLIRQIAFTHRLEHGAVHPDLGMATHAGVRGRNACERRSLNRCVAVAAIDSVIRNVMLVTERNRLHLVLTQVDIVTVVDLPGDDADRRNQKHNAVQRGFRKGICCAMKNLGHESALAEVTSSNCTPA